MFQVFAHHSYRIWIVQVQQQIDPSFFPDLDHRISYLIDRKLGKCKKAFSAATSQKTRRRHTTAERYFLPTHTITHHQTHPSVYAAENQYSKTIVVGFSLVPFIQYQTQLPQSEYLTTASQNHSFRVTHSPAPHIWKHKTHTTPSIEHIRLWSEFLQPVMHAAVAKPRCMQQSPFHVDRFVYCGG